ncbi:hypothetical protein ACKWTF_001859 [Chironomus riparius]
MEFKKERVESNMMKADVEDINGFFSVLIHSENKGRYVVKVRTAEIAPEMHAEKFLKLYGRNKSGEINLFKCTGGKLNYVMEFRDEGKDSASDGKGDAIKEDREVEKANAVGTAVEETSAVKQNLKSKFALKPKKVQHENNIVEVESYVFSKTPQDILNIGSYGNLTLTLDDYCGLGYKTWVSNRIVDFAISSYMAFTDISDECRESIFIANNELYLQYKYFFERKERDLKIGEGLLKNLARHTKDVNILKKKNHPHSGFKLWTLETHLC